MILLFNILRELIEKLLNLLRFYKMDRYDIVINIGNFLYNRYNCIIYWKNFIYMSN